MSVESMVRIRVNGEPRSMAEGISLTEMLRAIGIDPAKVAVERNLEIVPRSTFDQVRVAQGDAYEIVHFVGGG